MVGLIRLIARLTLAWVSGFFHLPRPDAVAPPNAKEPLADGSGGEMKSEQTKNPSPLIDGKTPKKIRASATQLRPNAETLTSMLDSLDQTFLTMRIPQIDNTWLSKRDVNSLYKLGVNVPTADALFDFSPNPTIPKGTNLPSIASAHLFSKLEENGQYKHLPRFVFCIRMPRLPHLVAPCPGAVYQFGYCYEDDSRETASMDACQDSRLMWVWCWLVVRPDGAIVVPRELRDTSHTVYFKRSRKDGPSLTFTTRSWKQPTLARMLEKQRTVDECVENFKCVFRSLIVWWSQRENQWSVGVRKDGHRVTFSIAKEHTAAYFADRDRTVNVNGSTKRIVHFVREHTRSNGAVVKEHVRGMREFNWRGYECFVTAPKLNGHLVTAINVVPELSDEDNEDPNLITSEEFAIRVADAEDGGFPAIRQARTA